MTGAAPRGKKKIDDLRETFPARILDTQEVLYRAHSKRYGPLYYCTCGGCRFDPPARSKGTYGACCTAYNEEIAVLEHLPNTKMVTTSWAYGESISRISLKREHKIADLSNPQASGTWEVDGDLQAGDNRGKTQSWGSAFQKADFHGVAHKSRRDPGLNHSCIAFFGRPGENDDSLSCLASYPISTSLQHSIELSFGVRFFPATMLSDDFD